VVGLTCFAGGVMKEAGGAVKRVGGEYPHHFICLKNALIVHGKSLNQKGT